MKKQEIDSILLANTYLVKCKLKSSPRDRQELARKYLTSQIKKTLEKRQILNQEFFFIKVFSFFLFGFVKS